MKTIEEFNDYLALKIPEILPDKLNEGLKMKTVTVTMINDRELHGISFETDEAEAAPVFYMEDLYEEYLKGAGIDCLAAEAAHMYLCSLLDSHNVKPKELDFSKAKDHLALRLLDIRKNVKYLKTLPYINLGYDLALICDIQMDDGKGGCWRTNVQRGMFEDVMNEKELFEYAFSNVRTIDPPVLTSVSRNLNDLSPVDNLLSTGTRIKAREKEAFYILTNKYDLLGASVLFYPGIQEEIADKLGESYYAIPSSIHEFLIVPESAGLEWHYLRDLVLESNREVVGSKEALTDKVFYYDYDLGCFSEACDSTVNTSVNS